jgi:protoporphyrinogen oxidase
MLRRRLNPRDRVVILGAGPTGLGAAHRLRELGHTEFVVLERSNQVGGLATSFVDARGFTWDVGGHIQVSHYPYFDELLTLALGDQWLHHRRDGRVYACGQFIPYPFQSNLAALPPPARWDCIRGMLDARARATAPPANFAEWLLGTYGEGICAAFMRPFNSKAWSWPLELMDHQWIRAWASARDGALAAGADLERTLATVLAPDAASAARSDNANEGTFPFPARGGTGAIWNAVADLVGRERVRLRCTVERVDPAARRVLLAGGAAEPYDVLISSLPVDRLVAMAGLDELAAPAARLGHAAVHIVGVGLAGQAPPHLDGMCWLYFPDPDIPFHRATIFSKYSPQHVPPGGPFWSVMTETSASAHKPVARDTLVAQTCAALQRAGVVTARDEVVSTWSFDAEYGYPIPTLGRDAALAQIHPALARHGIFSRGRFGGWKYEVSNQDQAVMQGVELVNRLLLGVHEVTYWFPHVVNDPAYFRSG